MKSKNLSLVVGTLVIIVLLGVVFARLQYQNVEGTTSGTDTEQFSMTRDDNYPVEKAYLYGVQDSDGYATAMRAYEANQYVFSVEAYVPDKKDQLSVWVDDAKGNKINLGEMERNDNQYYFEYQTGNDLRAFSKVVISQSSDAKDQNVLTGEFKGDH